VYTSKVIGDIGFATESAIQHQINHISDCTGWVKFIDTASAFCLMDEMHQRNSMIFGRCDMNYIKQQVA